MLTAQSGRDRADHVTEEESMAHRRRVLAGLFVLGWLLAGCGGDDRGEAASTTAATTLTSTTTATSTSAAATTTAGFAGKLIQVRVAGGKVETAERRVTVAKGDRVRIQVESDVAEEVHVHGYDLSEDVGPGKPATIEFTANLPGVWEVELENAKRKLFDLEVR
jgi:FtsP/CotA-like multicopper oxidase with cupredoxin domain